jgi:hypothetical protein
MITGIHSENKVYIDGELLSTGRSRKLRDHAPDGGVSWSYLGSGPSQLSLALLLHFGATDKEALEWYQELKQEIIANLPPEDFEMDKQRVIDWLEAKRLFVNNLGDME